MRRPFGRGVGVLLAASALILGLTTMPGGAEAPSRLEPADDHPTAADRATAPKAASSRLAQTDPALARRADATRIPVVIKLDYDSLASYQGGVNGLEATSPEATGQPVSERSPAQQEYRAYIEEKESAAIAEIQRQVPEASFGRRLRVVYGGVAAILPANRVKTVLGVEGVVAVHEDARLQPLTDSSPEFIGAPTLYNEFGGEANAGEGVIYGNLDTGLWPEHPSFEDQGNLGAPPPRADGTPRTCEYGDNPLSPANDPFVCQNKLIGGEAFLDTYSLVVGDEGYPGTARDDDGHGTHTASTSAGNIVESAPVLGVDRGPIHGIAPGAWVIEYRVCGPQGCFSSDSAAAVEEAILDGVDVINFSISGGVTPFTDPVELAFLDAYAAGVLVSASAGNSGPTPSTVNHLAPWTTTVAASTQTREFQSTLSLASGADTLQLQGVSITAGAGPLPVVLAADFPGYEDAICEEEPAPGMFDGLIVACERGGVARVFKGYRVFQGGGEGMILYNPVLQDVETDNHWVPTIHLAEPTAFLGFMEAHEGAEVTGTFTAGEAAAGQGDVMAAFSSRGPAGHFLKPDITAPGVQILAGASPTPPAPDPVAGGSPPGEYFQAIAGTSMSSPHIAGSALLLAALHPDWTPGQIRSAMMTTATTDVVKEDLVTPADPLDMGAGRVDLNVAGYAPLAFDETVDRFFALGNDPVNAVHLNLPSVNAPVMPGRLVITRVATNVSGLRQRFTTSAEAEGGTITVLPRRFTLDPNESATISIVIESSEAGGQHFGTIHLTSRRGDQQHLPVAFIPSQGSVNLVQSCLPATIPLQGTSTCEVTATNNSFNESTVDFHSTVNNNLRLVGSEGAALTGPRSAELTNVQLTGRVPGVPAIEDGELFGYLPLDDFGVEPIPVGDEEVINFGVPAFVFAGETYTTMGVTSNGYLVAGEATAEDVVFTPPGEPEPSRPNNVLAPFWTDLDGTEAEGILAEVLTDGVDAWIVVEWRLNIFGTTDERVFQTWIGINGVEDITYAYDPDNLPEAPPADIPFAVGAENILGTGGEYLPEGEEPEGDLRIVSTDSTPGASASYTLFVRGVRSGEGVLTTEMDADGVPGTTVVHTPIRVLLGPPPAGVT